MASNRRSEPLRKYLVFGLWDDAWWPLWENERHMGNRAENVIERTRYRLEVNGEEQYERIAAVPAAEFTQEAVSSGI